MASQLPRVVGNLACLGLLLTAPAIARDFDVAVTDALKLPFAVGGQAGGLVQGRVVSVGGTSWSGTPVKKNWHVECRVLTDQGWEPGPALPTSRADLAYASCPRGLFVAGGSNQEGESDEVLALTDVKPDSSWNRLASLPHSIQGASAAIDNETLFVAGGTHQGTARSQLWSLDLKATNAAWKICQPLPAPGRSHCGLVITGGKLFLLGGFDIVRDKGLIIFDDAWRYDPSRDHWEQLADYRIPGYAWSLLAIDEQRVLSVGRVRAQGDLRGDVELLDLRQGTIRKVAELTGPTCCAPLIRTSPQSALVLGGEPNALRTRTDRVNRLTWKTPD